MRFSEMLQDSRPVTYDEFILDSGGIAEDVVEMFTNPRAHEVREMFEADIVELQHRTTSAGTKLGLRKVEFGAISKAPEVLSGEVAAVDGTFALPRQDYSTGSAVCVAVGSASMTRNLQDSLHYWSSTNALKDVNDVDDFLDLREEQLRKPNDSAFMRYFEGRHALNTLEPFVFVDGLLCDEWLANTEEGASLYREMLENSSKKYMGVIKSCKKNLTFSQYARACPSGHILLVETLYNYISRREEETRFSLNSNNDKIKYFWHEMSPRIIRGVFKPYKRAFAFEVLEDHLEDMLRILAADAHMNQEGHEIPYLLNLIDSEIRRMFKRQKLLSDIALRMNQTSDSIYQEEWDEHIFRPNQA